MPTHRISETRSPCTSSFCCVFCSSDSLGRFEIDNFQYFCTARKYSPPPLDHKLKSEVSRLKFGHKLTRFLINSSRVPLSVNMSGSTQVLVVFTTLLAIAFGNSCPSPTATVVRSYTTTDASVLTTIAFVSQFDLKCGGTSPAPTTNFYAEVEGRQLNVARSAKTGQYQVSWTEEIAKAQRGDYKINIYDEDTFAVVKKGKGELPTPLVTVTLNHPGAYSGPLLSSEHLAAIFGVVVVYIAITSRSKLLA